MATRSTIWKQQKDGSFKGIYCHWDGYPQNNGNILLNSYQDELKIDELISLGSLSVLDNEVKPKEDDKTHSFDNKTPNVTVAYHRDRGDELNIYKINSFDKLKLKTTKNHYFEAFNYIWMDGKWFLGTEGSELTQEMCK